MNPLRKDVKYKTEQEAIKTKVLDILQLESTTFNPSIKTKTLHYIDQEDVKQQLLALIPELRQYYAIQNKVLIYTDKSKRPYLSVIKEVLKKDYKITSSYVNEDSVKTRRYYFNPVIVGD